MAEPTENQWVARFHAGDRAILEACYREHFSLVTRTVGTVLSGADKETVVHDVFLRLIDSTKTRESFSGGSFASWLRTVARNRALDFVRRHQRESNVDPETAVRMAGGQDAGAELRAQVRQLLEQFVQSEVPGKWRGVFEARFVERLSQRDAARKLGMHRTTLAYQEQRLRSRLRRFVLRVESE